MKSAFNIPIKFNEDSEPLEITISIEQLSFFFSSKPGMFFELTDLVIPKLDLENDIIKIKLNNLKKMI